MQYSVLNDLARANRRWTEKSEHFDIAYSDFDDDWAYYDEECMLPEDLHEDVCNFQCIRASRFSESKSFEVVLDSGADGFSPPHRDRCTREPISVNGARIAEVGFGPIVFS